MMKTQLLLLKKLTVLFFASVLLSFSGVRAQILNPGDMAVIGWNALTDKVHLVALVDIDAGMQIKITDRGWNGSQGTNAFTTLVTGDGVVTWTVSGAVTTGTVLELFLGGSDAPTTLTNLTTSADLSADITISTYTVADPIIISGDQVFIYQGMDNNPRFIFGLNNSSGTVDTNNWNTVIGATLRDSYLPNGIGSQNALTNGVNAIGLWGGVNQQDNVQYTGPMTQASRGAWLGRIADISNWAGSNGDDITNPVTSAPIPLVKVVTELPVRLVSFSGSREAENSVGLHWEVAEQQDIASYIVESSSDGLAFEEVGTVTATQKASAHYTFTHTPSQGGKIAYYRLRIAEADGTQAFSKIISIMLPGRALVSVYPVPADRGFWVEGQGVAGTTAQLFNIHGIVLETWILSSDKQYVDISSLQPGMYFVRLQDGSSLKVVRK